MEREMIVNLWCRVCKKPVEMHQTYCVCQLDMNPAQAMKHRNQNFLAASVKIIVTMESANREGL